MKRLAVMLSFLSIPLLGLPLYFIATTTPKARADEPLPYDECDPSRYLTMKEGGVIWKCSPEGRLVRDHEAERNAEIRYARLRERTYTLGERIMTDSEVAKTDPLDLVPPSGSYDPEEIHREYRSLLIKQAVLRSGKGLGLCASDLVR